MKKQISFFLFIAIFAANFASAQMMDYFVPISYHNPLLRSGQFMTSLYYSQNNSKTEMSTYDSERKEYSMNFAFFLGLTDWMTLSSRLRYIPQQTITEMTGDRLQEDTQDAAFHPEFVLSLRPKPNFEIFSSVSLLRDQYTIGGATVQVDYIDPVTGIPIPYEQTIPGYDYKISGYELRCGLSYAGRLW